MPKADLYNESISIKQEYKKHSCSTFYIQMLKN